MGIVTEVRMCGTVKAGKSGRQKNSVRRKDRKKMIWQDYIPTDIAEKYEIHDIKHAAAILSNEFPQVAHSIYQALRTFTITVREIKWPGGNRSIISKNFAELIEAHGWDTEQKLIARTLIDDKEIRSDTHKIDFVNDRVALDFEWNSKDQTYDRDLFAFRTFFEFDKISLGILITRSNSLDPLFSKLGLCLDKSGNETAELVKNKYGASTTHMGKLLPRLEAGRNGGCPMLIFGITPSIIELDET